MGIGEIIFILAIALILFGPEDLPNIARKIGKVYFEIRKATNAMTKEFQSTMDTPVNLLNKAFEHTTSPRAAGQATHNVIEKTTADEKFLKYEDEIPVSVVSEKASVNT